MAFDFSATNNKNYLQAINQNAPDAGSALKVLSLNLPNVLGGSPIAPDALLRPGLSVNAQVGGTAPAPAVPSALSAALSGQLGSPAPPPPLGSAPPSIQAPPLPAPTSPTGVSPFTTAAIADVASNALAPPSAPPGPQLEFKQPRPDVTGGGAAPDALGQLLATLFGNGGGDSERNRI